MQRFPSITTEEFEKACREFYDRATEASDSSARLQFANTSGVLTIKREYRVDVPHGSDKENLPLGHDEENEQSIEDEDPEMLSRTCASSKRSTILVEFSILRSEVYEVPVLWLTLRSLPSDAITSIEAIYEYLVPKIARPGLRQIGVIGGISVANHPLTDLPAFFVHPCNTSRALEEVCQDKSCSPEEYLIIWLGLVGPSVNLYIPSQLLLAKPRN